MASRLKIHRLADIVFRLLNPAIRIATGASMTILFCLMLLTVFDVLLRKLMDRAILGSVELTEMMMVAIVFLALSPTEISDGHIKVDLATSRLNPKIRAILDALTQSVACLLFALMTFSTGQYALGLYQTGEVTQDLWLPLWPFALLIPLGCGLLCLALFFRFLSYLREVFQG